MTVLNDDYDDQNFKECVHFFLLTTNPWKHDLVGVVEWPCHKTWRSINTGSSYKFFPLPPVNIRVERFAIITRLEFRRTLRTSRNRLQREK
jgi:hypothetical protein